MKANALPSRELLVKRLSYCPDTGIFRWVVAPRGMSAGAVAGSLNKVCGYVRVKIDGRSYYAHRMAWLFVHGVEPPADIDHINRDRADNRIANLREATRAQNMHNRPALRSSLSGKKGISWNRATQRWTAEIKHDGKRHHLGYFKTADDAADAYRSAALAMHGEFART